MTHVLVVCAGNTCRSPMAEAVLRRELERAGRDDVTVSSAGTDVVERTANASAVATCAANGLDISGHRTTDVSAELLARADVILVMTRRHLEYVGDPRAQLLARVGGLDLPGDGVPDPFGKPAADYERTFALFATAAPRIVAALPVS